MKLDVLYCATCDVVSLPCTIPSALRCRYFFFLKKPEVDFFFFINTQCHNVDRLLSMTFLEIHLKILHQFVSLFSTTMIWLVPILSIAESQKPAVPADMWCFHIRVWRHGKTGHVRKPKTCH